jgi:hypothetical protein
VGIGLGLAALCSMQAIDLAAIVQKTGPADRVILKSVVVLGWASASIYYFALAVYKAGRT